MANRKEHNLLGKLEVKLVKILENKKKATLRHAAAERRQLTRICVFLLNSTSQHLHLSINYAGLLVTSLFATVT